MKLKKRIVDAWAVLTGKKYASRWPVKGEERQKRKKQPEILALDFCQNESCQYWDKHAEEYCNAPDDYANSPECRPEGAKTPITEIGPDDIKGGQPC